MTYRVISRETSVPVETIDMLCWYYANNMNPRLNKVSTDYFQPPIKIISTMYLVALKCPGTVEGAMLWYEHVDTATATEVLPTAFS